MGMTGMRTSGTPGLALTLPLFAMTACDGCLVNTTPDEDGGSVLQGNVFFFNVHDGDNLTLADDADATKPGFQFNVEIHGDITDGSTITVTNDLPNPDTHTE